jgi:hypothetical protein
MRRTKAILFPLFLIADEVFCWFAFAVIGTLNLIQEHITGALHDWAYPDDKK